MTRRIITLDDLRHGEDDHLIRSDSDRDRIPLKDPCDVVVAIPSYDGSFSFLTHMTLDKAVTKARNMGITIAWDIQPGSNVAKNRNKLVERAIDNGAKRILFVDTDMVIPKDMITKLVYHDRDIVTGIFVSRKKPWLVMAFRYADGFGVDSDPPKMSNILDWPKDRVIDDLDGIGTGVLMIKTSVFEKIRKPYFNNWETTEQEVGGEDIYFCHKARKAGFRIVMDSTIHIGHQGEAVFKDADYLAWRDFANSRKREQESKTGTDR